jgi:hypothetical protein
LGGPEYRGHVGDEQLGAVKREQRHPIIWVVVVVAVFALMSVGSKALLLIAAPVLVAVLGEELPLTEQVGPKTEKPDAHLQGLGTSETWQVVVTLDPGLTEGLAASNLVVAAPGTNRDLPAVEVTPGPPLVGAPPLGHVGGQERHQVEWPIDIPADCADGCRLVFPFAITQTGLPFSYTQRFYFPFHLPAEGTGEYPYDFSTDSFSFNMWMEMEWEDGQAKDAALGDGLLDDKATFDIDGPIRRY